MTKETYPKTLSDLGALTDAETQVRDRICAGHPAVIADGRRPLEPVEDRRVRAGLIRLLALGGDGEFKPHPQGVAVEGAWIDGTLNVDGCQIVLGLALESCLFTEEIKARNATLARLSLSGSFIKGIEAERVTVRGSVLMRRRLAEPHERFLSEGSVSLYAARIDGLMSIGGGRIVGKDGLAVDLSRTRIGDGLYLNNGFDAEGGIRLSGAQVTGQVTFSGAEIRNNSEELQATKSDYAINAQRMTVSESLFFQAIKDKDDRVAQPAVFEGGVKLTGVRVEGELICDGPKFSRPGRHALDLRSARIDGPLRFKGVDLKGQIDLGFAQVGALRDDPDLASWLGADLIRLNGFTYKTILEGGLTWPERQKWLKKNTIDGKEFEPQPYQQLAEVLGAMGHRIDRARVLMAMEKSLRAQQRKVMSVPEFVLRWPFDHILGFLVGYGYFPSRALVAALIIIIASYAGITCVWKSGDMTPSAAPILVSADWKYYAKHSDNPGRDWSANDGPGRDYETFKPLLYAVDVFVPLVSLGQENAWGPSTSRGRSGRIAHWVQPVVELLGWIVTALGAAAMTGVIRRD